MDSKLIDLFREKVNNNGADFVLHRYRNNNGKNQWSIICSAMDWISVVVGEIDVRKLSKKISIFIFQNCSNLPNNGMRISTI